VAGEEHTDGVRLRPGRTHIDTGHVHLEARDALFFAVWRDLLQQVEVRPGVLQKTQKQTSYSPPQAADFSPSCGLTSVAAGGGGCLGSAAEWVERGGGSGTMSNRPQLVVDC